MIQTQIFPLKMERAGRLILLASSLGDAGAEEIFQDYLLLKSGNQGRDENEVSTLLGFSVCLSICLCGILFVLFHFVCGFCYLVMLF